MTQVATILVKRQSDGYQLWGKRRDTNLYTTPGGKFEDNESPEQAATRELFEEAGIVANPDQLVKLGVREFPERNLTVHCFVVTVPDSVKPSSANDPDHEVSVWEWLPTMPIDTHAKPNALKPYAKPKFTLRKLQTRAKDASGHEHKANGQFGSGGSASEKKTSGKDATKGSTETNGSLKKIDTSKKTTDKIIEGKPLIGQGAYRKVYDNGDSVIKVAKTTEAKTFNMFEAENSTKSPLFAQVLEIGPGGAWIKQEKLTPIKGNNPDHDINPGDANLLKSLGIPDKEANQLHTVKLAPGYSVKVTALTAAVNAAQGVGKVTTLPKSLNPLIAALKDIQKNVPGLDIGDFAFASNWGIDKNGKPKISDYSLLTSHIEKHSRSVNQFTLSTRQLQTRAPGQVNFTVIQSKIAPTDNNKIFKFIASTNEVDRHGTRLLPLGCQHINFDKNPVFLWNHNKDGLPDDVIGRVFTLEVTDSAIIATVEFMTERPDGSRRERAWQCWQDVLAGILKAVSVGFVPLAESPTFKSAEESAKYLAGGGIIDVTQWDLCELSLCPIGSNPDALQVRKFTVSPRIAQKRYSARPFTIRCVPISSKG